MKAVRAVTLPILLIAALTVIGCGSESSDDTGTQGASEVREAREQAQRRAARLRAEVRREARVRARKARARQIRQAAIREERAEEEAAEAEASECDPNYVGACLDPSASDYDCEGGSGDGPLYTGTVSVVGEDHYGLDANSDGVGCE